MKTILLAAGIGQRLGQAAAGQPKCLLQFGGQSLLQRHLAIFGHYGLDDIIIVTGYQADVIEAHLQSISPAGHVLTVHNPDYTRGSLISMLTGLKHLADSSEFLLMDADVLYDHRIIGRLLDSSITNCFLLDRDFEAGDEPVKLCIRDGQLVEFRKKIDDNLTFDLQGESVGFFRFSQATARRLADSAEDRLARGDDRAPYEECIRDLLLATPAEFGYEDISGLHWIEIDFAADVERAEREILPAIAQVK